MWSPVFIYELHSPTNCLSTYQYHRLFYFKVRLGQKKASTTSIFETSHHYTHAIVSWILLSHVCLAKLWWFIILRACTLQVSTKSWRHPKYTISLLVILTKIFHTHAHTNTHTHPHKISSLGSSRILIIKSRCKYVKLWTSLSVSVLMGHQNFSSTVGQQLSQPAFTCSKLTKETIQQVVKYVQS